MPQTTTSAEITVQSGGVRVTLRVASSLEDFQRGHADPRDAVAAHEFADLVHRSLSESMPALLQERSRIVANLSRSYIELLNKAGDAP